MTSHPTVSPSGATAPWYYANAQNQPVGPLSFMELQQLAAAGVVNSETQVIQQGGTEWQPFATVHRSTPAPQTPATEPLLTRWHQRRIVLPLLCVVPPLGLVLLWMSKRFGSFERICLTLLTVVFPLPMFIGIVSLVLFGDGLTGRNTVSTDTAKSTSPQIEQPRNLPSYQPGQQVAVEQGRALVPEENMIAELVRERDREKFRALKIKLNNDPKTGDANGTDSFVVRERGSEGEYYKLEQTSGKDAGHNWYVLAGDIATYVSPEEREAKLRLKAEQERKEQAKQEQEAKLAEDRAKIEKLAKELFHSKLNSVEVNRITGGPSEGLYNVEIRFQSDETWSTETQRKYIELQMVDAYAKLFNSAPNIWEVFLFAEAKLMDKLGNESTEPVYKTALKKSVADKINWANKSSLDFTQIWELLRIHPALRRGE